MQKNSRHFGELDPAKIGGFAREQKQFSEPARPRKLLDHVRDVLRGEPLFAPDRRGVSGLDSAIYSFSQQKAPARNGALEVELYLTHLAVGEKVSANTQKQALNALVFLYHRVLQKPLGQFRGIERAKRPQRCPLVLSKGEAEQILRVMRGTHQLIATLLFGTE